VAATGTVGRVGEERAAEERAVVALAGEAWAVVAKAAVARAVVAWAVEAPAAVVTAAVAVATEKREIQSWRWDGQRCRAGPASSN